MNCVNEYHQEIAVLITRIILGTLFFFQGYDAIFNLKVSNVAATYENAFLFKGIPKFLTLFGAILTSYTALLGGAMLLVGFFEYVALFILCINLVLACFAFSINTPMWDTQHVFLRLALLLFLLITPQTWHTYSLDNLLFKFLK